MAPCIDFATARVLVGANDLRLDMRVDARMRPINSTGNIVQTPCWGSSLTPTYALVTTCITSGTPNITV